MVVAGYPKTFTKAQLCDLIGSDTIFKCEWTPCKTEVTFKTQELAQQSLIIDGVTIQNKKLSVKPLVAGKNDKPESAAGPNNLYVQGLPKELSETEVRRIFAKFGRITSIKLLNKLEFTTNIAYVAFSNPEHAATALASPPLGDVTWHKPKEKTKVDIMSDITNQLQKLEELNLFKDP